MPSKYYAMTADEIQRHLTTADQISRLQSIQTDGERDYPTGNDVTISGRLATVRVCGPLLDASDMWLDAFGYTYTSLSLLAQQLDTLRLDPQISAICLLIDSPGGTVQGTEAAANSIKACRSAGKPVVALVYGECCSGAYWLASQCESIACRPTSIVGSLGVYAVLYDDSRLYESVGVRPILISSGDVKGQGNSGVGFNAAFIENEKQIISRLSDLFKAAVTTGRGRPAGYFDAIWTGAIWTGTDGLNLGLVDFVLDIESLHAKLVAEFGAQ